ncbi:aromatic alcohol reductase [Aspergillus mulundensis]|uniref:NmrA-like domain-containing protein n=1 Tax=Aspergillus mulundensis TaxID=1810919 RepID=A0A3D8SCP3_9EURO|nr:Uncharacterized protein DSM5745_04422 [Aspergillus mulundensis]RDW84096.1 Uncharacterized protein DSM5745_04422 [Aspergillus mulundensis]
MPYKNIVLAGATGNFGPAILNALATSNLFTITVLTRSDSKPLSLPSGVASVEVDYTSVENLTAALTNASAEAVVSVIPPPAAKAQENLIHAAVAAGVKRFLPSEFGSDLDIEINRTAPTFKTKVEAQELLKGLAGENKISYTFVYNGLCLDWGLQGGFPVSVAEKKVALFDGGERVYSTSTLGAIGKGVVSILSDRSEETANRSVRISEAQTTAKELLSIAQGVVGAEGWEISERSIDEEVNEAWEKLKAGTFGHDDIFPFIHRAIWGEGAGGLFGETDNELLGIKVLDKEGLKEIVEGVAGK